MLLMWIMAGYLHKKDSDNFNQNTASLNRSILNSLNNIQNTANNSKLLKSSNFQFFCNRRNHLKTGKNKVTVQRQTASKNII